MNGLTLGGALCFGLVVGWITYRTLRRTTTQGLSDLTSVIGAIGGATILLLFPQGTDTFGMYAIGLAVGFFSYFGVSLLLARKLGPNEAVWVWMGERPRGNPGRGSDEGAGRRLPGIRETGGTNG